MKLNKSLLKHIALHLSLMVVVIISLVLLFFQFLLPVMTRHGEALTVPSIVGISLEEADTVLNQRQLRFAITDETTYLPEYPPMTVLQQHPKAGAQVKSGRKIYLTINSETPPEVPMPNLVDSSVRNAQVLLNNQGLLLGEVKYVPDVAQDAVLVQQYQGENITPGTLVGKGSKIDLVVGAGLGKRQVQVPEVVGMKLEEAKLLLLSTGIKLGNITYEEADTETEGTPGAILQQLPAAGSRVYVGEVMDLWIAARPEGDSVHPDTLLPPTEES